MTCREKYKIEYPDSCDPVEAEVCPDDYGYLKPDPSLCNINTNTTEWDCNKCWDREIPDECFIRDSGNRREFGTGAVRDMAEGKGRCDLMPLDVVGTIVGDNVYNEINKFLETGDEINLITALAAAAIFSDMETMFLEVAKHFEEGCAKYGENNWRKGIPVKFYIDSAIRHYLKYRRGDRDEPHDRAFCWNILCAIWTYRHLPEMRGEIGNEQNKHSED